jgi:steroid 5-alpha reductase family enzyme
LLCRSEITVDGLDGSGDLINVDDREQGSGGKGAAIAWCALAYLAAIGAAVFAGSFLHGAYHPLIVIGVADAVGTVVIFAFSRAFNNSSFYDPYWSVAPMVMVVYWISANVSGGADAVRAWIVFALVWVWGARLTYNFLRGWPNLRHEDWRYVNLRQKNGWLYWPVSFLGIHFAPTAWVFLGCLALYPAYASARPFGALDAAAALVTAGAIALETIADRQLWRFRRKNTEPGAIMKSGLWKWSRHPNYLGEIGFWWGVYLLGVAADPAMWWTVAGPVGITLLFVFISIPMIDKRHLARRPGYAEHARAVPALIPLPRGTGSRA